MSQTPAFILVHRVTISNGETAPMLVNTSQIIKVSNYEGYGFLDLTPRANEPQYHTVITKETFKDLCDTLVGPPPVYVCVGKAADELLDSLTLKEHLESDMI